MGPIERELWEAEGEEDVQSSGYGVLHSSIVTTSTASTTVAASSTTAANTVGTTTPETDTGTDFGLLGTYTKGARSDVLCLLCFGEGRLNDLCYV